MSCGRKVALAALAVLGVVAMGFFLRGFLDPYRLPWSDWWLYQKNFISPDGRVIDTGNGDITHSEGQGYALIIAHAYEDRKAFDRIWEWTRKNLQTRPDDKLLSWLWKTDGKGGGAVADINNASDGDLLVAWALARAYRSWGDYRYQQASLQILSDLARLDVVKSGDRNVLLPGTVGFVKENGITLNPSYYVFPALAEVARNVPTGPWKELEVSGGTLVEQASFGAWKLVADWVLDGEIVTLSPDFPPLFGYNAVRVPLHIAWHNPRSKLLQPIAKFWKKFPGSKMPATVNLETDEFGPDPALPGVRAVAAFTIACAENQRLTVRALPDLNREEPYFSASLNLLTKIAVRESFSSN